MRTLQRGSRNRRLTLSHTLPLALAVLEVAGATAAFSRPFNRSSYELSSAPATVTLADLDGDGAGGIGSKRYAVPVGADPTSLASGDLDGNGTLDVVVGNSGDGTMTVFLRNN